MKNLFLALALLPSLAFSQGLDTILRPAGNKEVALRFQSYLNSNQGCKAVNEGPRVIMTGFGLWSTGEISYSGFVLDNMTSNDFWKSIANEPSPGFMYKTKDGVLKKDEAARIVNRSFTLKDGREISACLILVDVQWDLAGAIIVNEMNRFQPDSVIMTGVDSGGASIEGGALNTTSALAGYHANGKESFNNTPVSREILSDFPRGEEVPMTWDSVYLATKVKPLLDSTERLLVPGEARPSNIYVCNNVSYLALKAAENNVISLANGMIELKPNILSLPQVGFFHYPNVTTNRVDVLKRYSKVLMTLIEGTLVNK